MAIGINWAEIWNTAVWGPVWATVASAVQESRQVAAGRSKRRTYVIKGKSYKNLTREEVSELLDTVLVDAVREDVQVAFKFRKPIKITRTAWKQIKTAEIKVVDDDDELILMLA
jgi:hypothetical protein